MAKKMEREHKKWETRYFYTEGFYIRISDLILNIFSDFEGYQWYATLDPEQKKNVDACHRAIMTELSDKRIQIRYSSLLQPGNSHRYSMFQF